MGKDFLDRVDGVVQKLDKYIKILSLAYLVPCVISLLIMLIMVTVNVIYRDVFLGAWQFVEEWSGYLLVMMIYFGLAYTLRTGGHVSITLVTRLLPWRVRTAIEFLMTLVALAAGIFWMKISIEYFQSAWEIGKTSPYASHTPLWIPRLFVPLGLGLFLLCLALLAVQKGLELLRGVRTEEQEESPLPY